MVTVTVTVTHSSQLWKGWEGKGREGKEGKGKEIKEYIEKWHAEIKIKRNTYLTYLPRLPTSNDYWTSCMTCKEMGPGLDWTGMD